MSNDSELFTTAMRRATRKAHAISDALVNAKLLFALNDNSVWAEGLLVFYEIFKFLESAMKEKKSENLGKLYVEGMDRTSAFEDDLKFYLGENWKANYSMRDSVKNYLSHLESLLNNNSDLLMAYVYHLYLGLLSGGQILQKKRELQNKFTITNSGKLGAAVTHFEDITISNLKTKLKENMNLIAKTLDKTVKSQLIEESIKVFELNNSIIRTVKGTSTAALKNIFLILSIFVVILAVSYYFIRRLSY